MTKSLTSKEKMILEFIETYVKGQGISPTFTEIKNHFDFASINSVQRYIQQLESKGYLQKGNSNEKRSLKLLKSSSDYLADLMEKPSVAVTLPLLGKVAAGLPLEEKNFDQWVDVPMSLVHKPKESFVLRVQGESMIEEGIHSGDLVIIEKHSFAPDGSLAVISTEDESATVKRIFYKNGQVELRPANSKMKSMWYEPHEITLQGLVIGLMRNYSKGQLRK